jgi:RHS repeat-associated protein
VPAVVKDSLVLGRTVRLLFIVAVVVSALVVASRSSGARPVVSGPRQSVAQPAFPLLAKHNGSPLSLTGLASVPSKPSVIAPITQTPATVVPTVNPTLEVSSTATEPISYQFQVATDSGFTNIVCQSGWLPTTASWTLPDACVKNDPTLDPTVGNGGPGGLWYWRAQAEDADGPSQWSNTQNFKVYVPMLGDGSWRAMWPHGPIEVNLATGNLVVAAPGPSFSSVGGSLGVSFTYNSDDSSTNGLGPGWQVNAIPTGPGLNSTPSAIVDHQNLSGSSKLDAAEVQYPGGTSQWFHHIDGTSTFIPVHNATSSVVTQNGDNSWTLTDSDGTVYQFNVENASGKATLKSVDFAQDHVNNGASAAQITYTFSTVDPTKINHIADSSGRQITFVWHSLNPSACGTPHLLCVTLYDSTGAELATWLYDGDASGRLFKVSDGVRTLYQYTYGTANRIIKIQNPNDLDPSNASPGYNPTHAINISYTQDATSNLYDVTSVQDGPIFTQPSGKQTSTWTFQYLRGAQTTATRDDHAGIPAGTIRTAPRETEVTPPNQQGAASPKTINYFIDGLGHLEEIDDALGHVSEFGYDLSERGNLEWLEDHAGNPTDNTWDSLNNVLLETQGPDAGNGLGRPATTYRYDEQAIGTASTPGPALQGLQGWYFIHQNLTGTPVKETDPNVDVNWGTSGPPALNQGTNYSVQWVGDINLPSAGDYTFSAVLNGGARFHIDQIHAFHDWSDPGTLRTLSSQPISLSAGKHPILLDYFKGASGSAEIHLHWSCADCSPAIPDQVVPQGDLLPAWNNMTSVVTPAGRLSFSHYAAPWTSLPDYTLQQDSGLNYVTTFAYDNYGRVIQRVSPKGNAAMTIDANGNLSGTQDTTYSTTYAYYGVADTAQATGCPSPPAAANQAGQLASSTPHGLTPTTYVYDAFGSVLQVTDAAGTTCNTYTAHEDRINTSKAPGETLGLTYTYDPAGEARSVTGDGGVITAEHDEAGRLSTLQDNYVNNFGPTVSFTYDQDGNPTQRVAKTGTSQSSNTTTYTHNDGDQLTSVTDPAGKLYKFWYDAVGNIHAIQYPNATFSWTDRNADNWITAVYNRHGTLPATLPASVPADSQSSPISDFSYVFNVEGEETQEQRTGGGLTTETTSYGYDNLGRLSTVALPDGTNRVYSYDLDSNRTQIAENGSTVASYSYDPSNPSSPGLDELTSVTQGTTTNYTYAGDGQVVNRGGDTLNWDGRGRLTGGTFAGSTVSYQFDPLGFRKQRSSGSSTTWYALAGLFEGTGSSISDATLTNTDVDGPASADLAHYAGLPRTTTTVSYEYYDRHNDLVAEADANGARTAAYTYDPFGALRSGTAPSNATSERWLAGDDKKLDSTSGLIEMGARPYDPTLGRFLATDPVDGGSCNSYDYSFQDPVNSSDPSGTDPPGGGSGSIGAKENDPRCPILHITLGWAGETGAINKRFSIEFNLGSVTKWEGILIDLTMEVAEFGSPADTFHEHYFVSRYGGNSNPSEIGDITKCADNVNGFTSGYVAIFATVTITWGKNDVSVCHYSVYIEYPDFQALHRTEGGGFSVCNSGG